MQKPPENGLLIFAGIDNVGKSIFEMIEPRNPIHQFYYSCGKKFETDRFMDLFEEKPEGFVVFMSGSEALIYQFCSGKFKKVKTISANLINRQRKGGQSAVRFDRLAEASRHDYIVHLTEHLNRLIVDPKSINWVFGGEELKKMLLAFAPLKPKFLTESLYHSFNLDTIHDRYFANLMVNRDDDYLKAVDYAVELIQKDPDMLLFSEEEIRENQQNVEWLLSIQQPIDTLQEQFPDIQNIYRLQINHKSYGKLQGFNVIAKLFYKQ